MLTLYYCTSIIVCTSKVLLQFVMNERQSVSPELSRENELHEIRARLVREGVKHKGRPVPFGVTNEVLTVPENTIEKLREAGNVAGNFLAAVNTLMTSEEYANLRKNIPELAALNRPETTHLNNIAPEVIPSMFRLDLIVKPDGGFETSEIELLMGGLGYNEAIRNSIFPRHPVKSGATGFASMLNYLSQGRGERCSVVTLDLPIVKPYVEDLNLFGNTVRKQYSNYDLVYSKDLRLDRDGNLITTDNPDPIRFVHRFFEIYMGTNGDVPNFDLLVEAYKKGTARDLPSMKQFLEEKLTMALLWKPELQEFFEKMLGSRGFEEIRKMVPKTKMLTPETTVEWNGLEVPVTNEVAVRNLDEELRKLNPSGEISKADAIKFAQNSPLVAHALRSKVGGSVQSMRRTIRIGELVAAIAEQGATLRLGTIPREKRLFITKLSGYSEGAAEAKSVEFYVGAKIEKADEMVNRALKSDEIYVIQQQTPHRTFSLNGLVPRYEDFRDRNELEPKALEQVYYEGFARVEPHYFQTGPRQWELGEVTATVTPDKKTHGRTDAIVTVVNV